MSKYKAVFFDLDHTLWDFELNSSEAISELFHLHQLQERGIPGPEEFIATYKSVNRKMWDDYHRNLITKETLRSGRFRISLESFGIKDNNQLPETLAAQYLQICPAKNNLFPGALEILQYLTGKYSLHIITNGFKEVQYLKIKNSGLKPYFENIHISEEIGFKKPEPQIFDYAVKKSGAIHQQCLMIGDNLETDIAGAENAGIDPVFFNPTCEKTDRKVMFEIYHLDQIREIL